MKFAGRKSICYMKCRIILNQFVELSKLLTCVSNRILTTGLSGAGSIFWAHCLQSDDILRRILWIAENTLNPHLIEKVTSDICACNLVILPLDELMVET